MTPSTGEGAGPYAERFGAAMADITTPELFFRCCARVVCCTKIPAIFGGGPEFGVWHRVGYALSRVGLRGRTTGSRRSTIPAYSEWAWASRCRTPIIPTAASAANEVAIAIWHQSGREALGNLLAGILAGHSSEILPSHKPFRLQPHQRTRLSPGASDPTVRD